MKSFNIKGGDTRKRGLTSSLYSFFIFLSVLFHDCMKSNVQSYGKFFSSRGRTHLSSLTHLPTNGASGEKKRATEEELHTEAAN